MHIRLQCRLPSMAVPLAADLERELGATVSIAAWQPGAAYVLRYRALPAAQLQRVLDCLGPMTPECNEDASLEEADVELQVGWEDDDLRRVNVYLACENAELAETLAPLVTGGLGMTLSSQAVGLCGSRARFDIEEDVPAGARDALAYWLWKARGVKLRPRVLPTVAPGELQLRLPDPRATGPVQSRVAVAIETDDVEAAATLRDRIASQGFTDVSVGPISEASSVDDDDLENIFGGDSPARATSRGFRIVAGALGSQEHGLQMLGLRAAVEQLLGERGIDMDRFPLGVEESGEWGDRRVRIVLPISEASRGALRAYGGAYPERFSVRILCDEPAAGARLASALKALGHTCVSTGSLADSSRLEGFRLHWGAAALHDSIATPLADAVRAEMAASGVPREFALSIDDSRGSTDDDVVIQLPITGAVDGSLLGEINDPSRFALKVHAPDPELWRGFTEELQAEGWSVVEPETHDAPRTPSIHVGGAPDSLVSALARRLRERLGKPVRIRRLWGASDCDVWLYLPSPPAAAGEVKPAARAAATTTTDAEAWFHSRARRRSRPRAFIERTGDQLRVGEITLPCHAGPRHRLAPDPAAFSHYTLDAPTAGTLQHLALSVRLREPALLEGETSTSKTSSILYLAALLNQPVIRLNLNGQTDTSELVGRYVPAGPDERGWRWQDGLLVQAMRQGWWVVLDELNLAEPQVIERLNPVLEAEPSLVLTEGDGSVLGAGGDPVHPEFRILATQNPAASYAGRVALSPAARDRFRALRIVPRPTQRDHHAMLRRVVFGEQPAFELQGTQYTGEPAPATPGTLSQVPGVADALRALATLHASLEEAGAASESGGRRGERQVHTRRSLLSVLGFLNLRAREAPFRTEDALLDAVREAVVRYYVERVPPADRAAVLRLAEAAGLAPREWGAAA
jgi:hypothetical protein